ncbi:UNVERIFIED_ORG: DNA-binding NtrC family response regulator [Xanthobacter viscosus]|jgi:DNA-binding NtrC family response regulator|uniref:Response regulator n=1 Tax=Xanthobacter autotrophicus TaxID=280 RepID=A0A6C1KDB7_XANAU|nr:response regulator [Xanthobacter autotrophicus]TLX41234.1 response regulator [Xanthobacter autotrophicus]
MSAQGLAPSTIAAARTVLLVEDDALVRLVTAGELRDAGLTVIEAASAQEAYEAIIAGLHVDVVFTDVRTEGTLDGYELARMLKAERPSLPVILTSGHLDSSVAALVAPFLAKPYSVETVIQLIHAQFASGSS